MKKRSLIPFALAASLMSGSALAFNGPGSPGPFWDEPPPPDGCYEETIRPQSGPQTQTVCPQPHERRVLAEAAYAEMNWPVAYENFRALRTAEPHNPDYTRLMLTSALYAGYTGELEAIAASSYADGNRDGVTLLALATKAARLGHMNDAQAFLNAVDQPSASYENYFVAATALQFNAARNLHEARGVNAADMLRMATSGSVVAMRERADQLQATSPAEAQALRDAQAWAKVADVSVRQNLAPMEIDLRAEAAAVYAELGRPQAALRELDAILPEDRSLTAHRVFAETYTTLWGADAGAHYLETEAHRLPRDPTLQCMWADALARADRPAEAQQQYNDLLQMMRSQNYAPGEGIDQIQQKREAVARGADPGAVSCPIFD